MSRRFIQSLDVEYDPTKGSILTDLASPTAFPGGTKLVTGGPEPLVEVSTPCRFVWIGARVDDGGLSLNSSPCFVGDAADQNLPIMQSNFEGMVVRIDDAAKVYVRAVLPGDGVAYRIFQ